MAYSNRKFYFGLGMSMVDFFKEPIRYLKRSMEKESQFEKPYWTGGEYQKMHFAWPDWDWRKFKRSDIAPMRPAEVTGLSGAVGEPSGGWGYKFLPPKCQVWAYSMDCGYPYEIGGTTGYVAIDHTPPHDAFAGWTVTLESNPGEDKVELIQEDDGLDTWFFSKNFELNLLRADFSELTIYATGHFWGEYLLGMDVLGIWNPLTQAYDIAPSMQNRPFLGYPNHPSNFLGGNATKVVNPTIPCEPHTMPVDCCALTDITWDSELSGSLIEPESSIVVAVTTEPVDSLEYELLWSVSGDGYWLETAITTNSRVNTLYAGLLACGYCTVKVTACYGALSVSQRVKCTEGKWNWIHDFPYYEDVGSCYYSGLFDYSRETDCEVLTLGDTYSVMYKLFPPSSPTVTDCVFVTELGFSCTCSDTWCDLLPCPCPEVAGFSCSVSGDCVRTTGFGYYAYRDRMWGC